MRASPLFRGVVIAALAFAASSAAPLLDAAAPAVANAKNGGAVDTALRDAILTELAHASGVGHHTLRVEVKYGVATLAGQADNLLEKERAVLTTLGIRGVRAVVDHIAVPAVTRTDSELTADAVAAMTAAPVVDAYPVTASAKDGVVTLGGQVDSHRERLQAVAVAKSILGVRDVVDKITVPVRSKRLDSELQADVRNALRWDRLLDDDGIRVNVNGGHVTLTGTVDSGLEKLRAENLASLPGVHDVKNELAVVEAPWRTTPAKEHAKIPDATIAASVRSALSHDPRTDEFELGVTSSGHIVTLTGVVDSVAAKRSAAQTARNTVGVVTVVDKLTVVPPLRNDKDVETAVRAALARDARVGPNDIKVQVEKGVVTLRGAVDSMLERRHADDIAASVRGARFIDNQLAVEGDRAPHRWEPRIDEWDPARYPWFTPAENTPSKEDAAIAADIRRELIWSPFVDADDIKVTVRDGTATLEGTVDSPAERAAATENAIEGGATRVHNLLNSRIDL